MTHTRAVDTPRSAGWTRRRARRRIARPDAAARRGGRLNLPRRAGPGRRDPPPGRSRRADARAWRARSASRSPRTAATMWQPRPPSSPPPGRPPSTSRWGVRRSLAGVPGRAPHRKDSQPDPERLARRRCARARRVRSRRADAAASAAMAARGLTLVPNQARVLTHCNTGALVSAGEGTAFAVVLAAHRAGRLAGSGWTRPGRCCRAPG